MIIRKRRTSVKKIFICIGSGLVLFSLSHANLQAQEVTFRWFGQACFQIITSQNSVIVADPMAMGGYAIPKDVKADIVTISHEHSDHNRVDAVAGSPIVLRGLGEEPIERTIKDVKIYSVDSFHDDTQGSQRGENAIFVFEFDGIRVAHLGDLGHTLTEAQVEKIGRIDVLMIPIGGRYTIFGDQADRVIEQLEPKMIVFPMHFKTAAAQFLPYSGDDFVQGKSHVKKTDGNTFTLDLKNPPQELQFVVLNYK
jgi:L-ascorbate metabolism protein UlaG (beta-lactamase superfamily)